MTRHTLLIRPGSCVGHGDAHAVLTRRERDVQGSQGPVAVSGVVGVRLSFQRQDQAGPTGGENRTGTRVEDLVRAGVVLAGVRVKDRLPGAEVLDSVHEDARLDDGSDGGKRKPLRGRRSAHTFERRAVHGQLPDPRKQRTHAADPGARVSVRRDHRCTGGGSDVPSTGPPPDHLPEHPKLSVGSEVDAGPHPVGEGGEGGEGLLPGDDPLAFPRQVAPAHVDFDRPRAYTDAELDNPVRRRRPSLLALPPLSLPLLGRRDRLVDAVHPHRIPGPQGKKPKVENRTCVQVYAGRLSSIARRIVTETDRRESRMSGADLLRSLGVAPSQLDPAPPWSPRQSAGAERLDGSHPCVRCG